MFVQSPDHLMTQQEPSLSLARNLRFFLCFSGSRYCGFFSAASFATC